MRNTSHARHVDRLRQAVERLTIHTWKLLEFEEQAEARGYMRRGWLRMGGTGPTRRLVLTAAAHVAFLQASAEENISS